MKYANRNTFVPRIESLEDRQLLAAAVMPGTNSLLGTGLVAVTRTATDGPRVIPIDAAGTQDGARALSGGHRFVFAAAGAVRSSPSGINGLVAPDAAAGLNDAVLAYAVAALGTQVGDGGCWALADEALKAAGADTSGDFAYVFGSAVDLYAVIPGDVLQFEGVHFEGPDPATGGTYWQDFPHHTAIVYSVNGSQITLLNQNVNGDTTVQFTTINLNDLQYGTISAYRPQLP
jgi:hypothetical protein